MPIRQEFQQFLETRAEPAYKSFMEAAVSKLEQGVRRGEREAKAVGTRYRRYLTRPISKRTKPFTQAMQRLGERVTMAGEGMIQRGQMAPPLPAYAPIGDKMRVTGGALSRMAGRLTRGVGNVIQRPVTTPVKFAAKTAWRAPGQGLKAAKAFRRGIKAIPKPVRRFGTIGGIALGLTAMLGVSVLKGAMNQGRQIAYDRYMEDATQSRNVLSSTRLGNASGTNRMLGYGGTVGLSNSLSKTRHGRG